MNDLDLKPLTRSSASFAKLEEVFYEAFPPEEIAIPFSDYVALSERFEFAHALEIADGDKPVGLFIYFDSDEGYAYLNFIAMDASQRGRGYGKQAFAQMFEFFGDTPLVADIERPVEGADGYDIKLRRQKFYERLGFYISDEPFFFNEAEFLMISNKPDYLDPSYMTRLGESVKEALK